MEEQVAEESMEEQGETITEEAESVLEHEGEEGKEQTGESEEQKGENENEVEEEIMYADLTDYMQRHDIDGALKEAKDVVENLYVASKREMRRPTDVPLIFAIKALQKVVRERYGCVVAADEHAFLCPITLQVMDDPVVCADGYTYERSAISMWMHQLEMNDGEALFKSPMTNEALPRRHVFRNHVLANMIQAWKENKDVEKDIPL